MREKIDEEYKEPDKDTSTTPAKCPVGFVSILPMMAAAALLLIRLSKQNLTLFLIFFDKLF